MKRAPGSHVVSKPEPRVKARPSASEQPRVLRIGGPQPGGASRPRDYSVLGQASRGGSGSAR